jgi:hypothetical protein
MKAQPPAKRWLTALLLVGLWTQAAVAAVHLSTPFSVGAGHEQPTDGDERGRHDPASCSFCRIASILDHALSAPSPWLPIDSDAVRPAEALPGPRPVLFTRPTSRAPPGSAID